MPLSDYDDDDRVTSRRRRDDWDDDDDYDYDVRRRYGAPVTGGGLQLGLGIAALSVGILGLFLSWIPVVGAMLCGVGLVLGVVAVVVAVVRGHGYGFPIAGAIVSGVSLAVAVILTVVILAAVGNAVEQVAMQGMAPVGPPTPAAGAINLVGGKGQIAGQLVMGDPFDRVQLQSHCKVFTVVMTAGRTYQIDMMQNAGALQIDPFLRLEDSEGNQLMTDDDGGGNLNARIVFTCQQNGTFRVVATSLFGGTGGFTLRIEER